MKKFLDGLYETLVIVLYVPYLIVQFLWLLMLSVLVYIVIATAFTALFAVALPVTLVENVLSIIFRKPVVISLPEVAGGYNAKMSKAFDIGYDIWSGIWD